MDKEYKYDSDVGEKIDSILAFDFKVSETGLQDDMSLVDDLGFDSIRMVEFIMRIETVFGIDDFEENIKTTGDLKVAVAMCKTKEKGEGTLNY